MTRYTRLGKSTHQRQAGEATTWDSLKSTPQKDKNSRFKSSEGRKDNRGSDFQKKRQGGVEDRRRTWNRREEEVSSNFVEVGVRRKVGADDEKKNQKSNVKGVGQSKTVKIFGQFWVPADDAKRLQGLVKKLRDQGLSRKDIGEALKNERRRAEKAAKRIRDKNCFGCRQFGHVLSECPKGASSSAETVDGSLVDQSHSEICFKCGSTEHSSRHCKKKGDKFDFAKCFICSKVGHISRQCPDNTRGIYPGGGECNICKEMTHLAKDCPMAFGKAPLSLGKKSKDEGTVPVMSKLSNPFASTEYEPETSFSNDTGSKPKKRRVKF